MGSHVTASCPCGFQTKSLVGGGISNHDIVCLFPCVCRHCNELITVNLYDRKKACPHCRKPYPIPYHHPVLYDAKPSDRPLVSWNARQKLGRVLRLTNGAYRCPQCNHMTLRFAMSGIWFD